MTLNGSRYRIERVDWKDPLSYPREMYGVPAREGGRIRFNGRSGRIVGADGQYLRIVLDAGEQGPLSVHPTWRMEYLDD